MTASAESSASWIESARRAVDLARDADEAQRQVTVLDDSEAELAGLVATFQRLADAISVIRQAGWDGRSLSADAARDLREAADNLGERPLIRSIRALERFGAEVEIAVKARWRAYASEQLGDVSDLASLSETLSEVDGIAVLSQGLGTTLGNLARSEGALPSKASLALLADAKSSLRRLEDSLRPESVRSFLSAVAQGGSPVHLLTSDVLEWLSSHDALTKFRIVAGPPAASHV